MRIQHNISAINSQRNIMTTDRALSKNLEKLSSGYRINRAGDDAAGLAISEAMRNQITAMNQGHEECAGRNFPGADGRRRPDRSPYHAQPHEGHGGAGRQRDIHGIRTGHVKLRDGRAKGRDYTYW